MFCQHTCKGALYIDTVALGNHRDIPEVQMYQPRRAMNGIATLSLCGIYRDVVMERMYTTGPHLALDRTYYIYINSDVHKVAHRENPTAELNPSVGA